VLDRVDATYRIGLWPRIVEHEFAAIWKAAESQGDMPEGKEERAALETELRRIAERRARLGVVIAELARRFGIQAAHAAELEDLVADRLVAEARVVERPVSAEELREAMG
jgi:FKBP-type peptidyl-prolyl cis-trans isomerase (trigger factor)